MSSLKSNLILGLSDILSGTAVADDKEYLEELCSLIEMLSSAKHYQEIEVLKTLLNTYKIQQHISRPSLQNYNKIPVLVHGEIVQYPIYGNRDFSGFPETDFTELVEKSGEQKIAFKILPILEKAEEIKNYFVQYLTERYSHMHRNVSMTEVIDNGKLGYEIIAYNSVVSNTEERIKFIEEFRKYLKEIDEQLPFYIIMDNTFAADESYDRWKSINSLRTAEEYDESYEKLVNRPNSHGTYITINNIYNINNSVNDSYNTTNLIQSKDKTPQELFIEHIVNDKPDWFVPETWIHINTFHEKYMIFDSSSRAQYFARHFKNILWTRNEQRTGKKMHYYLCEVNLPSIQ